MSQRCCRQVGANRNNVPPMLRERHLCAIDVVGPDRRTATMAQRCGSGSHFVMVTTGSDRTGRCSGSSPSRPNGDSTASTSRKTGKSPALTSAAGSPAAGAVLVWPAATAKRGISARRTATMGHGCVSVGVRRVSWVLLKRRGHFAMVFTGVKCPCLAGRDGGLRRMPGMPGYPGGIGRRHGSFRIMRRSRPETHSSGNPPMGHGCCPAEAGNRIYGPSLLRERHPWAIDAVARPGAAASMAPSSRFAAGAAANCPVCREPGPGRPEPGPGRPEPGPPLPSPDVSQSQRC